MIKGTCFTNLDEYKKEVWPEVFVTTPRKGEKVVSMSGITLTVVDVIYTQEKVKYTDGFRNPFNKFYYRPCIKIELNK